MLSRPTLLLGYYWCDFLNMYKNIVYKLSKKTSVDSSFLPQFHKHWLRSPERFLLLLPLLPSCWFRYRRRQTKVCWLRIILLFFRVCIFSMNDFKFNMFWFHIWSRFHFLHISRLKVEIWSWLVVQPKRKKINGELCNFAAFYGLTLMNA